MAGIVGNLFVPPAAHQSPPKGMFSLVLWQPNPNTANGLLVPTTWDASVQTGFSPGATSVTQLGFASTPGSSTAQMYGEAVGAYLNSADLPGSPVGQKMMITPQYVWNAGSQPVPFSSPNAVLTSNMDVQVPTAVGDDTYVCSDYLFLGPNGVRVSIGVKIFNTGRGTPVVGSAYDEPSGSYMLNSPIGGSDQRFVTPGAGSTSTSNSTWLGWRHFEWNISNAQFAAALQYLASLYPTAVSSADPGDYVLAEVHLNAEFHFQPAPAELGWSMRNWTVSVAGP